MLLLGFKNLLTQIVLLRKMPAKRSIVATSIKASSIAVSLYRWIAEVVPLLQQMDPQHRLQWVGRPATLDAGPWIVKFDQMNQRFPRHRLHLRQKELERGALLGPP